MDKEWPLPADRIGEVIGMEVDPALKGQFFVGKKPAPPAGLGGGPPIGLPGTNEDGQTQRKDRPPGDSPFDKSQTAPRDPLNDKRNLPS